MKVFGVWAAALLWIVSVGQAAANEDPIPSVTVTGSAEERAAPDKATLNVAADVKSPTVAEGRRRCSGRSRPCCNVLRR